MPGRWKAACGAGRSFGSDAADKERPDQARPGTDPQAVAGAGRGDRRPQNGYPAGMSKLLIVYHSRTGGSQQMAEAALDGARDETETDLKPADQAGPDDLLAADGYLFCAPENLAALSGVMKDFFDRCYYPVLGRIEGRPYAQMICAGSDGENAARQTARIAQGWRLRPVQEPLILCTHAQTPEAILAPKTIPDEELAQCREIGQALAAGLAMGMF